MIYETVERRSLVVQLVPVVVALKALPRGKLLTPESAGPYIEERRVPRRFAPPDSLGSVEEAIGMRVLARIPAGSYVGNTQLAPPGPGRPSALAENDPNGRVIEVAVS